MSFAPAQPRSRDMRKAIEILTELVRHVGRPAGCAFILVECIAPDARPNWTAASGDMPEPERLLYAQKLHSLLISDPKIDWSGEQKQVDRRRTTQWMQEGK